MKPQTRPFTVEVKSKRRAHQAPDANWTTVIDEPSPDNLPSRDVREDAADTPLSAAARVFSTFTSNAFSSGSTLGEFAASVFGPKPQELVSESAPALDQGRTGRILPSLLPVNRFEAPPASALPRLAKPKTKRPRKPTAQVYDSAQGSEPIEVPSDPPTPPVVTSELIRSDEQSSPHDRRTTRRKSKARVRAGEGWKRRRLPKACW
jgi:hypothetical protein